MSERPSEPLDPYSFGRMVISGCLLTLLFWIIVAIALVALVQLDVV
jgi:hypothetical protein